MKFTFRVKVTDWPLSNLLIKSNIKSPILLMSLQHRTRATKSNIQNSINHLLVRCDRTNSLKVKRISDMLFEYTPQSYGTSLATMLYPELDAGHFFWTRPDPAQLFYAFPKSKNCNAIFNRLITNFLQL